MDVGFMVDTMSQLARGVPLTLQLAATSVSLGFVLALCLALALETGRRSIAWPSAASNQGAAARFPDLGALDEGDRHQDCRQVSVSNSSRR